MSNRTYVCPDCRTSARAQSSGGLQTDLRCRSCSGEVFELSHRWRIPKQNDDKGWAELHQKVVKDKKYYGTIHRAQAVIQLDQVDQRIEEVKKQKKETLSKSNKLKKLFSKRKQLLKQYRGFVDDYESRNGEQITPASSCSRV